MEENNLQVEENPQPKQSKWHHLFQHKWLGVPIILVLVALFFILAGGGTAVAWATGNLTISSGNQSQIFSGKSKLSTAGNITIVPSTTPEIPSYIYKLDKTVISFGGVTIVSGQSFTINSNDVTITNNGNLPVQNLTLTLTDGSLPEGWETTVNGSIDGITLPLMPGQSTIVHITISGTAITPYSVGTTVIDLSKLTFTLVLEY